jgi:outer membrane protein
MTRLPALTLTCTLVTVAVLCAGAGPLAAHDGDWEWRLRAGWAQLESTSEPIEELGTELTVDSAAGLGFDLSYGLSHVLAASVAVNGSWHTLSSSGGEFGGVEAGSAWLVPVAFTLQYRPALFGHWQPYVGGGFCYGLLLGFDLADEGEAVNLEDIEFDGGFGPAFQLGVNYNVSESWLVGVDLTYLSLTNEVTLSTAFDPELDAVDIDLAPWQIVLAFGGRF